MQKPTLAAYFVEVWKHWEARFGTTLALILALAQNIVQAHPDDWPHWVVDVSKSFPPSWWLYTGAAFFLWASYVAWRDKQISLNLSEENATEVQGRPDIALSCEPGSTRVKEFPLPISGFIFKVRNSGPVQAVNLSIHDIVLPMSDFTRKQHIDMTAAFSPVVPTLQPGWDKWTVIFSGIASLPPSPTQAVEVQYRVDNMGPLQRHDICSALAGTIRPQEIEGFTRYSLRLPLLLEFSNLDGSRWRQAYELAHRPQPCSIKLVYKGIERIMS